MVIAFFIGLYTLAAAFLIGQLGSELLLKALKYEAKRPLPFGVQWLMGMALLSSLFSLLSLVMPLGLLAQLGVFTLALFSLVWLRGRGFLLGGLLQPARELPWPVLLLTILASATVLVISTTRPENPDTGLYHAQAIRWIETYPAVPGLANFNRVFGYNSSWLLTQALFSFAFLGGQSFHLNTAVLSLVAGWYFCMGAGNLAAGRRRYSNWVRTLFLPLLFYILSSEISSPGTDAPAALITWMVLAEWLAYFEDGWPQGDLRPLLLTVISVYALTIKLSVLPLVIAGIIVLMRELLGRRWILPLATAGLTVLILLPWLARFVVLTGYLVYPFPAVDIFQVDWKVPPDRVQYEAEIIRAWARLPRQDLGRVQSLTFRQWTGEWFANQTANRRMILLTDLAAPLGLLGLAVLKNVRTFLGRQFRAAWPAWLTVYAGLAFWFFSAPDFRFGSGFIIAILVLAAALPIWFISETWAASERALNMLALGILVVYQAFFLASSANFKTLPERLVMPADYPTSPTAPCKTAGVTLLIPEEVAYGQCWYGTFPCLPSCSQNFERRGPDWQDGFRAATAP